MELFAHGQDIRQHLCRMEVIGQTIPYRNTRILREILDNRLFVAAVFNAIKHSSQYLGGIGERFLFAHLGAARIQECHAHAEVSSRHFKGASCSG